MGIRKSIYFNEGLDDQLLEHAKEWGNFSQYVKRLILLDIERGITKVTPQKTVKQNDIPTVSHVSNTQENGIKKAQQPDPSRNNVPYLKDIGIVVNGKKVQ